MYEACPLVKKNHPPNSNRWRKSNCKCSYKQPTMCTSPTVLEPLASWRSKMVTRSRCKRRWRFCLSVRPERPVSPTYGGRIQKRSHKVDTEVECTIPRILHKWDCTRHHLDSTMGYPAPWGVSPIQWCYQQPGRGYEFHAKTAPGMEGGTNRLYGFGSPPSTIVLPGRNRPRPAWHGKLPHPPTTLKPSRYNPFPTAAYSPEDIVDRIKGKLVKSLALDRTPTTSVPNPPPRNISQQERARAVIEQNRISVDTKLHTFTVLGSAQPHVVTLFPKETCSCPSSTTCYHILAAKMCIGQADPQQSQHRINLTQLRKNARSRREKSRVVSVLDQGTVM